MRSDKVIDNNKGLAKKHNSFRTEKDISLATLDVLTDISETLAAQLDFMSLIYNRQVVFPGDEPQNQQIGGKGNG